MRHIYRRPSPQAQVEAMVAKFRSRLWSLRYLKKSGTEREDVCRAYVTYLRPVLEYSSVPVHSMLSREQSEIMERQQYRALKLIYGFHLTSAQALEASGLETLEARRQAAVDRFALKVADDPKFQQYFPLRPDSQRRSRVAQIYLEEHARTSRMFNNPFFYMRRRLNQIHRENQIAARAARPVRAASEAAGGIRCDFLYDEWR